MLVQLRRLRVRQLFRTQALAVLFFALCCGIPSLAASGPKPKGEAAGTRTHTMVGFETIGLPQYVPPQSFREDLVITHEGKPMTMKRFVDHGKIRTEMSAEGHEFIMVETGDSKGTIYTLMPEQKKAMKQSRQGMEEASTKAGAKMPKPDAKDAAQAPPGIQVEDLGDETLDGNAAKKLRMVHGKEGDVVGWFDKATGAPIRMESFVEGKKTAIEWKNRKAEPQPAELFGVPKEYEVMDMDQMMAQRGAMGGMGSVGGMAKGMAGGMVQGMGSNLGGSLGATLGGSLGGPLGAMAGQFLGGKIGGMLGKKAANAIN
jgi:hypothetical protein